MKHETYFKITERGKDLLFSTNQFGGLADILAAVNEAISKEEPGYSISDHILVCSSPSSLMTEEQWQAAAREHREISSESQLAEVNVDRSFATISFWGKSHRTQVSGDIARLAGCYEMSIHNGRPNDILLVTNLVDHCQVTFSDPQTGPAFQEMTM